MIKCTMPQKFSLNKNDNAQFAAEVSGLWLWPEFCEFIKLMTLFHRQTKEMCHKQARK